MKPNRTPFVFLLSILALNVHAELPGYLVEAFKSTRWVAYSPTGASSMPANEAIIRGDLLILQRNGFTGIVTYGCDGLKKQIPKIAHEVGIIHVIAGVFDPTNRAEIDNAKALAPIVDAYCIGNEGLLEKRPKYTIDEVRNVMDEIKKWTGRPVTTSEQIEDYSDKEIGRQLLELGDWIFPNVHPFWHGKTRQPEAGEWTRDEVMKLQAAAGSKLVLCKEVGLPTGSDDIEVKLPDERTQAEYYSALRAYRIPFVYFEAFDQVWKKDPPVEPHWGIFDKDRRPKMIIGQLIPLAPGVAVREPHDNGRVVVRLGEEGGFFDVSGTVTELGTDQELLLFVNTGDPAASGWFLQLEPNGISEVDDGRWVAKAQIGNKLYRPRKDQKIALRLLAVPKAEAARLKEARGKDIQARNKGIKSQELPKTDPQWRADVRDIELDLGKLK